MKHHEFSQSYLEANVIIGDDIPWLVSDLAIAVIGFLSLILCIWSA